MQANTTTPVGHDTVIAALLALDWSGNEKHRDELVGVVREHPEIASRRIIEGGMRGVAALLGLSPRSRQSVYARIESWKAVGAIGASLITGERGPDGRPLPGAYELLPTTLDDGSMSETMGFVRALCFTRSDEVVTHEKNEARRPRRTRVVAQENEGENEAGPHTVSVPHSFGVRLFEGEEALPKGEQQTEQDPSTTLRGRIDWLLTSGLLDSPKGMSEIVRANPSGPPVEVTVACMERRAGGRINEPALSQLVEPAIRAGGFEPLWANSLERGGDPIAHFIGTLRNRAAVA